MASAEADPGTGVPRPDGSGAWTEEAYLALSPADRVERRVELLDGSLLVAPGTGERHAAAVATVRAAVAAVLPDGLEVTGPVALRLAPGRILVPDLVVAAPAAEGGGEVRDSAVALVVIDVVGRANGVADRWFKPQLYAGCRIPYALLVDHDEPFAVGSMLIGGRFHEYAEAGPGDVLRLDEPFPLELDLSTLLGGPAAAGGTRPGPGPGTRPRRTRTRTRPTMRTPPPTGPTAPTTGRPTAATAAAPTAAPAGSGATARPSRWGRSRTATAPGPAGPLPVTRTPRAVRPDGGRRRAGTRRPALG